MSGHSQGLRKPIIQPDAIREVANGLWVIPDTDYTPFVPNVGIAVGARAALIIDTGFGGDNARAVLQQAHRLAGQRPIYLTHTHCHPEHGFGANAIDDEVTTVCNTAQWQELQEKGAAILRMFRDMLPPLAPMLDGVTFLPPRIQYSGFLGLDLGGIAVEFHEVGGAHSRGDQCVLVRTSKSALFVGDLIEERHFGGIADNESRVGVWISRLAEFEMLRPDVVVPGHGHIGDSSLIAAYREHFELAVRRVGELREAGQIGEAQIVENVTAELIERYPDWLGPEWAKRVVENLTWPSRR